MHEIVSWSRQSPALVAQRFLRSRIVWCVLIVAYVFGCKIFADPLKLVTRLGDTDDALRLHQIHEWVAHGRWFDTLLPQVGAPDALVSHWSRLIDIAIASLIGAADIFVTLEQAEIAARIMWPALLLLALSWAVIRDADRQAGTIAALAAAALIATSPMTVVQFAPGRIDHHNVQILCTISGIIMLQYALTDYRLGWAAGAVFGLGLAIGLEALPLIVAIIALAALFSCFYVDMRAGLLRVALAITLVTTLCFAASTPPSRWFIAECDMASLNLIAFFAIGAFAIALMTWRIPNSSYKVWLAGLAGAAVAGLTLYLFIEPACIAGPFGKVDPAIKPIWLDRVIEGRSLIAFAETSALGALSYLVFSAFGILATVTCWRRKRDRDSAFRLAALGLTVFYGGLYVKLIPYGTVLVIPALAAWIATLPAIGELPARTVRLGAVVFANQATMMVVLAFAGGLFTAGDAASKAKTSPHISGCDLISDLRRLSLLPRGLIAADIDLGAHIVANSHHRVVAAPYHRIDRGIIALNAILASPPAQAEHKLRSIGVDYVVLCAKLKTGTQGSNKPSLAQVLRAGAAVPYLAPVSIGELSGPLKVWRVLGQASLRRPAAP